MVFLVLSSGVMNLPLTETYAPVDLLISLKVVPLVKFILTATGVRGEQQ